MFQVRSTSLAFEKVDQEVDFLEHHPVFLSVQVADLNNMVLRMSVPCLHSSIPTFPPTGGAAPTGAAVEKF